MRREKIIKLQNNRKKEIFVTGTLSLPLRVGERAWFFVNHRSVFTTSVEQILEVNFDGVIFQTRNTIYHLTYAHIPAKSEVICA